MSKKSISPLPHEGHGQHLCYLVSLGLHLSDSAKYRVLIQSPAWMCNRCGRVARRQSSLCKPIRLSQVRRQQPLL